MGPDAGAGVSQAAMTIQWPGQNAWTWGYRWQSSESKTGVDMIAAFVTASNGAFTASGLESGFITDLQWQGNSFPGFNAGTGQYLQYFVNNAQVENNYNDGASTTGGAHILPPLGSPYDEGGPGEWVASNTGALGRPLADGSWDGWIYAAFGDAGPGPSLNAPAAIPEPASLLLVAGGSLALLRRKRSA